MIMAQVLWSGFLTPEPRDRNEQNMMAKALFSDAFLMNPRTSWWQDNSWKPEPWNHDGKLHFSRRNLFKIKWWWPRNFTDGTNVPESKHPWWWQRSSLANGPGARNRYWNRRIIMATPLPLWPRKIIAAHNFVRAKTEPKLTDRNPQNHHGKWLLWRQDIYFNKPRTYRRWTYPQKNYLLTKFCSPLTSKVPWGTFTTQRTIMLANL